MFSAPPLTPYLLIPNPTGQSFATEEDAALSGQPGQPEAALRGRLVVKGIRAVWRQTAPFVQGVLHVSASIHPPAGKLQCLSTVPQFIASAVQGVVHVSARALSSPEFRGTGVGAWLYQLVHLVCGAHCAPSHHTCTHTHPHASTAGCAAAPAAAQRRGGCPCSGALTIVLVGLATMSKARLCPLCAGLHCPQLFLPFVLLRCMHA